jgi:hypothetical protein
VAHADFKNQSGEEEFHDCNEALPSTQLPAKHDMKLYQRNGVTIAGQAADDIEPTEEDPHAEERTQLERSIFSIPPTETVVLQMLQDRLKAIPKPPKPSPAQPTDIVTMSVRELKDEAARMQLTQNKRLDVYAGREASLKTKIDEWTATVVQTQNWIKEAEADGVAKKNAEARELASSKARIAQLNALAESKQQNNPHGLNMPAMKIGFMNVATSDVGLPTSPEAIWTMFADMMVQTTIAATVLEQGKGIEEEQAQLGKDVGTSAASASSTKSAEEAAKDRLVDNAKGATPPPQPHVPVEGAPAVKGENAPTAKETSEERGRNRERTPPPRQGRRSHSQDPSKDADATRRMDTRPPQNKRGAETQGDQTNPVLILAKEVEELNLPPCA